jgi:hypothetical protein
VGGLLEEINGTRYGNFSGDSKAIGAQSYAVTITCWRERTMVWKDFVASLTGDIPQSDKRFLGLKISLTGYLVAMTGILLLFGGFENIGQFIVYLGAGVGVVGIITQIFIMLIKLK